MNGQIVAGGNGRGNQLDQLNGPADVVIDKMTDSFIISDRMNRRVVRWSRLKGTMKGEILLENIHSYGLAIDDKRYLYVSDIDKHEVRRYQIGEKIGALVAGGYDKGAGINQLSVPTRIFVDRQQSVYVSDSNNHRVMKWTKDATEGIIVAGGRGKGTALTQLCYPKGLFVDALGTVYVADSFNHRVMRWQSAAESGTIIVGGNDSGSEANQLNRPEGLCFDRRGNLYVADHLNHRIQQFSLE